MFERLLIANRGEIAVRIIKTCRRLGISPVVVHSEADRDSLAVELADEAVAIGPAPAAQSYLRIDAIVEAARRTGAQAIHPGFGFLSERAEFAERLAEEGIAFVGPNARAIRAMGDKIESKRTAKAAGVSTVPGSPDAVASAKEAAAIAAEIGYPVMIKASAGGGGKGIRVAETAKELREGYDLVRAEAKGAFGDDRVFIEKFVTAPRHIEIQVLGDRHGTVLHLFDRECSIQRRNQKVVEEAPSPLLDAETRARMGAQAVALAQSVGYDSAGTVEFVASGADKTFYFLEMNTRLQVEHAVTEMITGIDLVEQMIRVAAGEKLGFTQRDLRIDGWAVESRIYAEDPYRNFLPAIGRLTRYQPAPEGPFAAGRARNDSGVREGDEISIHYDPMIAKLVTWGPDRASAIDTQAAALDRFVIEGLQDNTPFLAAVMDEPRFRAGDITTGYIKATFPEGFQGLPPSAEQRDALAAAAAYAAAIEARRANPHAAPREEWVVLLDGAAIPAQLTLAADGAAIALDGGAVRRLETAWRPGRRLFIGALAGRAFCLRLAPVAEGYRLAMRAVRARAVVTSPRGAALHALIPPKPPADTSRLIVSPMPGLVVSLEVEPGRAVKAGDAVAVVEAMKMQNIIRAERDGVVAKALVAPGASVAADEVLIELT